jgi:SOS-response transcriptional repressor LexA
MKKSQTPTFPLIARNLRTARLAAGFRTASDAARHIGIPVPTVIAHEGAGASFRNPKLDQLRRYAAAYNTTIDALEGGTLITLAPATRDVPEFKNMVSAPILGTAQAGNWREVDPFTDAKSKVYARQGGEPLFGVNVAGDSMNKVIQDGDVALIKPWKAIKREPRANEVLLVQREQKGAYELTIKSYRDGKLWPESTNPKWRHPVAMKDGDTITIVGLVVGLYRAL